jgi:hypothetical protein
MRVPNEKKNRRRIVTPGPKAIESVSAPEPSHTDSQMAKLAKWKLKFDRGLTKSGP